MGLMTLSLSQIFVGLFSISLLRRLTTNRFFMEWLCSYDMSSILVPSNDELKRFVKKQPKDSGHHNRPLASGPGSKRKHRHRDRHHHHQQQHQNVGDLSRTPSPVEREKPEVFKISVLDIDLSKLREKFIQPREMEVLAFGHELEWLADLAVVSIVAFLISETQFHFFPNTRDLNLSAIWTIMVIFSSVKILIRITRIYFGSPTAHAERSICIVSGILFFISAFLMLVSEDQSFEFDFSKAYKSFNHSTTEYFAKFTTTTTTTTPAPNISLFASTPEPLLNITPATRTIASTIAKSTKNLQPIQLLFYKIFFASFAGLLGVIYTFAGLRFGQLHMSVMARDDLDPITKAICGINYTANLFILFLWIKPLSRHVVVSPKFIIPMDDDSFDTLRIYCVILLCVSRFLQTPIYVGQFLSLSRDRLTRFKLKGGNLTNIEVRNQVASIYNYVNLITLLYILPIFMAFFTCLMYASMGDYRWLPSGYLTKIADQASINLRGYMETTSDPDTAFDGIRNVTTILPTAKLSEFRKIFSPQVCRSIFGYFIWILHFAWFACSSVGFTYHTYFSSNFVREIGGHR